MQFAQVDGVMCPEGNIALPGGDALAQPCPDTAVLPSWELWALQCRAPWAVVLSSSSKVCCFSCSGNPEGWCQAVRFRA